MKKNIIIIVLLVLLIASLSVIAWIWWEFISQRSPSEFVERLSVREMPYEESPVLQQEEAEIPLVTSVASGLEIPWSLVFLPDNSILVTERSGRVRLIDAEKGLLADPIFEVEDVAHIGEGGLLGIALHPNHEENRYVYLYYTYEKGEIIKNRIVRYTFTDFEFIQPITIIEEIPGAQFHNGGRIKFGPDGMLYVTTGDAVFPASAQNLESVSGKILRMTPEGEVPEDNPFEDSYVYTYGHRNPQGLAWNSVGELFATEHGQQATDEVNIIKAGANYGWPEIIGDQTKEGMVSPFVQSGQKTWAPAGAAFLNGTFYFTGLRGQALYEIRPEDSAPIVHEHFSKQFGRLRDVVAGPDGFLYLLTSNRDGRGVPFAEDDQILRVNPEKL